MTSPCYLLNYSSLVFYVYRLQSLDSLNNPGLFIYGLLPFIYFCVLHENCLPTLTRHNIKQVTTLLLFLMVKL